MSSAHGKKITSDETNDGQEHTVRFSERSTGTSLEIEAELYEKARAAVDAAIPAEVPDHALIRVSDVRELMVMCFLRGLTLYREQTH